MSQTQFTDLGASVPWIYKDPDDVLSYAIDWSAWLAAEGDTIASAAWSGDAALTLTAGTPADGMTPVQIAGGTIGGRHRVTCRLTTVGGLQTDRSFEIRGKAR